MFDWIDEMPQVPSTTEDLVREQTYYDGQFVPGVKWLLSDYDTWERNPHYKNPKPWLVDDSHPEDEHPPVTRLRVVQCNNFAKTRRAAACFDDDNIPF